MKKVPEYVRYIGYGEAGLKHGDIVRVLSVGSSEDGGDLLYVETPKQNSIFSGDCAENPQALIGKNFTYILPYEYELIKEEKKVETKHKFKVGDIVCGNDKNRYVITNSDMTEGEVIQIYSNGCVTVKVLKHKKENEIGKEYGGLNPIYFDLIVPNPTSLYHFTTNMKTFVNLTHGDNEVKTKCNLTYDKFDIHYGVDLALERLEEVEYPKIPKYVKITNKYWSGGGVKVGDICKVLCQHKGDDNIYIKCPKKTSYTGSGASDKNALIGVNFTLVNSEEYEPVDFNIYD